MPTAEVLVGEGGCVVAVPAMMGALVVREEAIIQRTADAAASHLVEGVVA